MYSNVSRKEKREENANEYSCRVDFATVFAWHHHGQTEMQVVSV